MSGTGGVHLGDKGHYLCRANVFQKDSRVEISKDASQHESILRRTK